MAALKKQKHELFAQGVAHDISPDKSYDNAYGPTKGSGASAARLLRNARICSRIDEIRVEIAQERTRRMVSGEVMTATEIAIIEKNQQVRAKGKRWLELMQIKSEKAAFFTDPDNPMVLMFPGKQKPVALKSLPGVTTGLVNLRFRTVAGKAVPELELDTAWLREVSAIEDSIGRMMGFIDPIKALQIGDTNNVNVVVMQCVADQSGQD